MFTRKKRQDKKEEAASATCFARLFLFVQGGVGWVMVSRRKRRLSQFETAFKVCRLSPPNLTFSAYTPLQRYIDQSNPSHLIQHMPSEAKCTFDSRLRSLFRFRNCLAALFKLAEYDQAYQLRTS
jgi:hypothetical protein